MGFRKGEDFYIALGQVEDLGQGRHQQADAAPASRARPAVEPARRGEPASPSAKEPPKPTGSVVDLRDQGRGHRRRDAAARQVLPAGAGRRDRRLHLARQGHHDPPRGLLERPGADEEPGALHARWPGTGTTTQSFRVELQIDAWDRTRLLEDLSRTFAETGINILEARCTVGRTRWSRTASSSRWGTRGAEDLHPAAAQHRVGVRRLSRDADGGASRTGDRSGQATFSAARAGTRVLEPPRSRR